MQLDETRPVNPRATPQDQSIGEPGDVLLQAFLRDADVPCPLCNYNLRGLTSRHCPECGRELRLTVGLTEPYLRDWLAATIAMCANGGIGFFFAAAIAFDGLPDSGRLTFRSLLILAYVASGPLALVLVRTRRRFLRLPRTRQRAIASIVVAASFAGFISLICVLLA